MKTDYIEVIDFFQIDSLITENKSDNKLDVPDFQIENVSSNPQYSLISLNKPKIKLSSRQSQVNSIFNGLERKRKSSTSNIESKLLICFYVITKTII